jgi:co-chaperonin GroES (HSP10)
MNNLVVPSNAIIQRHGTNNIKATVDLNTMGMIDPLSIKPVGQRILVRIADIKDELADGRLIVPQETLEKAMFASTYATIVSLGDEAFDDFHGKKPVAEDVVILTKYAGNVMRDEDGGLYRFANDIDVVAIVDMDKLDKKEDDNNE